MKKQIKFKNMRKKLLFKRVIIWNKSTWNGEHIRDNHILLIMLISMIPILGQLIFILALIEALLHLDIYYEETEE